MSRFWQGGFWSCYASHEVCGNRRIVGFLNVGAVEVLLMQILSILAAAGLAIMMLGGIVLLIGVVFDWAAAELDGGYLP